MDPLLAPYEYMTKAVYYVRSIYQLEHAVPLER